MSHTHARRQQNQAAAGDSEPSPDSFFPSDAASLDQKQAVMADYLANAMREMHEYEAEQQNERDRDGSSSSNMVADMDTSELLREMFGSPEQADDSSHSSSTIDMAEIDAKATRIRRAIQRQDPDLFGSDAVFEADTDASDDRGNIGTLSEEQKAAKQAQIEQQLAQAIMDIELQEFGYTADSPGTDSSDMLAELNRARAAHDSDIHGFDDDVDLDMAELEKVAGGGGKHRRRLDRSRQVCGDLRRARPTVRA